MFSFFLGPHFKDIVNLLLKFAADPNCVGTSRVFANEIIFPLMVVAKKGNLQIAKLLLSSGANIDMANSKGQSATHGSCSSSGASVVLEVLLDHSADVNLRDDQDQTPLHHACLTGTIETVDLLLKAGAQGNLMDKNGLSELILAACSRDDPLTKIKQLTEVYPYTKRDIIEAHETVAFTLVNNHNDGYKLAFESMHKATLMRQKHNLPKTVSIPLECYNFVKEWETLEDLFLHKDSPEILKVQAILARDRIYESNYPDLEAQIWAMFEGLYICFCIFEGLLFKNC